MLGDDAVSLVASILIPTRCRPAYLAVALASIAPQARQHGAEVILVEDDEASEGETARVVRAHGARHVAMGRRLGINAARNVAIENATTDLLCFVDDDVEVWPGWFGAILEAAESFPEHDVFGGPIRARIEGWRLRVRGREPPPITTLDLGPYDRDAEVVWGAPMVHAAYRRGRSGRRYDRRKGTAPGLGAELRLLAACAWHIPRHRCANGALVLAQSAGRLHERLTEGRGR